jgi:hypothetical protein
VKLGPSYEGKCIDQGCLKTGCPSRTSGTKKEKEITGSGRKLHNKENHNLYSSPNIIKMITSRKIRWERHVACMVDEKYI